jgi:thiol-disulfide isomerase/thioredoxin
LFPGIFGGDDCTGAEGAENRCAVRWLLFFISFGASAQHIHTVVDGSRKFLYTDTGGVTASYVSYFGSGFDPGRLVAIDSAVLAPSVDSVCVYNFWFTYCAPCVAEIPTLNRVAAKYAGRPVRFVGITWDPAPRAKAFLAKQPFDFHIVSMSRDSIQALKKVSLYPLTLIVVRGRISFVVFGRPAGEKQEEVFEELDRQVEKALNQ